MTQLALTPRSPTALTIDEFESAVFRGLRVETSKQYTTVQATWDDIEVGTRAMEVFSDGVILFGPNEMGPNVTRNKRIWDCGYYPGGRRLQARSFDAREMADPPEYNLTSYGPRDAQTYLTAAVSINASTISVPLADAQSSARRFPQGTVKFRIQLGSPPTHEIMHVTAGQGTATWTVDRGREGTTARAWNNGEGVHSRPFPFPVDGDPNYLCGNLVDNQIGHITWWPSCAPKGSGGSLLDPLAGGAARSSTAARIAVRCREDCYSGRVGSSILFLTAYPAKAGLNEFLELTEYQTINIGPELCVKQGANRLFRAQMDLWCSQGTNEQHWLDFSTQQASITGTYTPAFLGVTSGAINASANAATIQTALEAVATIGAGNVTVNANGTNQAGGNQFSVNFTGTLAATPLELLVPDSSGLSGGTATITRRTTGTPGHGSKGILYLRDAPAPSGDRVRIEKSDETIMVKVLSDYSVWASKEIRSDTGIGTKHEAGSTPTGGASGDIRVGTSKIWVNDAGTWKSVAVA